MKKLIKKQLCRIIRLFGDDEGNKSDKTPKGFGVQGIDMFY